MYPWWPPMKPWLMFQIVLSQYDWLWIVSMVTGNKMFHIVFSKYDWLEIVPMVSTNTHTFIIEWIVKKNTIDKIVSMGYPIAQPKHPLHIPHCKKNKKHTNKVGCTSLHSKIHVHGCFCPNHMFHIHTWFIPKPLEQNGSGQKNEIIVAMLHISVLPATPSFSMVSFQTNKTQIAICTSHVQNMMICEETQSISTKQNQYHMALKKKSQTVKIKKVKFHKLFLS